MLDRTKSAPRFLAAQPPRTSNYPVSGYLSCKIKTALESSQHYLKAVGADWSSIYKKLESAIKVRHYSPKKLKAYKRWIHHLQNFVKSKDPGLLEMSDGKEFLSFLAVDRNVSASSQNQSFNGLLFLFRHVLEKEFTRIDREKQDY